MLRFSIKTFPRTAPLVLPTHRLFSQRVYKNLPMRDLVNSYVVLRLCKSKFWINNIERLTSLARTVMGQRLFYTFLKATMGQHFTAGETLDEAQTAITKYSKQGFKVALGYMAEFLEDMPDEKAYDDCLQSNLDTLHLNRVKQEPVFFFAIKFTGLARLALLKKVNKNQANIEAIFREGFPLSDKIELKFQKSSVLAQRLKAAVPSATDQEVQALLAAIPRLSERTPKDSLNLFEWKLGCAAYNVVNPAMNSNPLWQKLTGYTQEELEQLRRLEERLNRTLDEMGTTKSFLLIDAEQSYVQLGINNFTEQMSYLQNYKKGHPCVFNTIQNYLLTARNTVADELAKKDFFGPDYPVLLKLVRGAYHKQEQGIEAETGKTIVFKKQKETDDSYNANCLAILSRLCPKSRLFVASHNEETVEIVGGAIDASPEKQRLQKQVFFGTLLGLNDKLAYECLQKGRTTVKFMPFGERHLTLPYMIRRSYEAKDLIRKNAEQVQMFSDEIWNRLLWK